VEFSHRIAKNDVISTFLNTSKFAAFVFFFEEILRENFCPTYSNGGKPRCHQKELNPDGELSSQSPYLLEIDRKNKNEEDQTNHRDTRILTCKTLQCEGKNHRHQLTTTFTIFVEYLQERRDLFRQLTRGLYSKTLICTARAEPPHPQASLRPKPPGDGPPLRSPTWPPSRNLDHNSTIFTLRQIPSCSM
jgi:hypothetical protein